MDIQHLLASLPSTTATAPFQPESMAPNGGVGAQAILKSDAGELVPQKTCRVEVDTGDHARAVLSRFVRNTVATWWFRRELSSCRALERAFTASDPPPLCEFKVAPLITRRGEHCSAPEGGSSRDYALQWRQQWLQADSGRENEATDGNESGSSSGFSQRATVETVVHNLYIKLEAATRSERDKDKRICLLEQRVAAIERENRRLCAMMERSRADPPLKAANWHVNEIVDPAYALT